MKFSLKLAVLVSAAMLVFSPAYAQSGPDQDTVITDDGKILLSTNGDCVRSKWQDGDDDCAPPAPEPVKKPVVQATPQPEKEERTVYFDFNSAILADTEQAKLDKLVTWLATSKGVTGATVYGFADQIGNAAYNQQLSAKRAGAVEKYLASKGVVLPTSVEIVKGLGETGSITNCDESLSRAELIKCLAADRRVEVMFETLR